jgi:hypothetical protein
MEIDSAGYFYSGNSLLCVGRVVYFPGDLGF